MNISVVNTFTLKKAGTENSEILNINTSTKELINAGFIKGSIILRSTEGKLVIIKALSSNCASILDKELPIISIDKGVNPVVKTNITAKYEDIKLELLKKVKKISLQATAKI